MEPDQGAGSHDGRSKLRRWAEGVVVVASVVLLVTSATRLVPIPLPPWIAVQSLGWPVSILCAVMIVPALLARRRRTALALAVATAIHLVVALPAFRDRRVAPSERDLTVLAFNTNVGMAQPDPVLAEIRARRVDVVVFTEFTGGHQLMVDLRGLGNDLPYKEGTATEDARSTMIYSRYPLTRVDTVPTVLKQPVVSVQAPSGPVLIAGVHTMPPLGPGWGTDLELFARWASDRPDGERLIVAGDFNAGTGHPGYRDAAAGFEDAALVTGSGWVRTWPIGKAVPAFTAIDHVLVRNLQVVETGQTHTTGSDHAAVWARVR